MIALEASWPWTRTRVRSSCQRFILRRGWNGIPSSSFGLWREDSLPFTISTRTRNSKKSAGSYMSQPPGRRKIFSSVIRSRSSTADYAWSCLVPRNSSRVFPKTCSSLLRLSMRKEIGGGSPSYGAISAQCRRVREWRCIDESRDRRQPGAGSVFRQLDLCLGKPDLCRAGRIERWLLLGRMAFSPRTFLFPAPDTAGDSRSSDFSSALYLPDC